MKRDFEYVSHSENDRLAMLEHRAAELERRLGQVTPEHGLPEYRPPEYETVEFPAFNAPQAAGTGHDGAAAHHVVGPGQAYHEASQGFQYADSGFGAAVGVDGPPVHSGGWPAAGTASYAPDPTGGFPAAVPAGHAAPVPAGHAAAEPGGYAATRLGGYPAAEPAGFPPAGGYGAPRPNGYPDAGVGGPDQRTEVLINRGRRNVQPRGAKRWAAHWRAIAGGAVAVLAAVIAIAVTLRGGGASWPASVATVQSQITVACQNPNVVAEPTQVNFACAKDTRQILWVFSLLTSGNNPGYSDNSNGRKGLEPITPSQGGDIAWSLNLHHPYDPASAADSLAVAARAINNIIGGATLTGANGAPVVQPGLESKAENCARYTGSPELTTRQGFPALCAHPVSSPSGQAALVSDVFQQWMVGTPQQVATEAGVLFQNADNPGDPRVQAILNSLHVSGL
jgi:hypothetical protein